MRGIGRGGAGARPRQIAGPYQANNAGLVGSPVAERGWANQWPGFGEGAGGPGANQYPGDPLSKHELQSIVLNAGYDISQANSEKPLLVAVLPRPASAQSSQAAN
jgi:hypothetical protein